MNSLIYQLITENDDALSIINETLMNESTGISSRPKTPHEKDQRDNNDKKFQETLNILENKLSTKFDHTNKGKNREITEKATDMIKDLMKKKEYRKKLITELTKEIKIIPIDEMMSGIDDEPLEQRQMGCADSSKVSGGPDDRLRETPESQRQKVATSKPQTQPVGVTKIPKVVIRQISAETLTKLLMEREEYIRTLKNRNSDTDQSEDEESENNDSPGQSNITIKNPTKTQITKTSMDLNLKNDTNQPTSVEIQEAPEVIISQNSGNKSNQSINIEEMLGVKPKIRPGRPSKKTKKAMKSQVNKALTELTKINKLTKSKIPIKEKDPRDNRPPPGVNPYALRTRKQIKPIEVPNVLVKTIDTVGNEYFKKTIIEDPDNSEISKSSSDELLETTIKEAYNNPKLKVVLELMKE